MNCNSRDNFTISCSKKYIYFTHSLQPFVKYLFLSLENEIDIFAPPYNKYPLCILYLELPLLPSSMTSALLDVSVVLHPFPENTQQERNMITDWTYRTGKI